MITFNRILCPVDPSPCSRRALDLAVRMTRWHGATLTVLSVRPPFLPPALPILFPSAVDSPADRQRAGQTLDELVAPMSHGIDLRTCIREGPIDSEILQLAIDLPADVIVMGTRGLGGLGRVVLGSVTDKVVRKARCPVLAVPPDAVVPQIPTSFTSIVCGTDFSPDSERAVEYALALAMEAGGRLTLLHAFEWFTDSDDGPAAFTDLTRARRRMQADARARLDLLAQDEARTWCDVRRVMVEGKPSREILRAARESAADLIVLGTHGHGMIDALLFGSTTRAVLRNAPCPVLTVPWSAHAAAAAA